MRISITLLCERLKKWNPVFCETKCTDNRRFVGAQLMIPGMKPMREHVLIGEASYFNGHAEVSEQTIICIGIPNEAVTIRNRCVCLSENANLCEVYNDAQEIFLAFNRWDEEMTAAVINNATLEELCLMSIPAFENPIFIHDTNFFVLANVNEMQGQFEWYYDETSKKFSLPLDILNDFKVSPEYQSTMNTVGAQMFSEQQFGYRILYINLRLQESYLGRICVSELGRKITDGDYELIEHFAYMILAVLRKSDTLQSNIANDLKQSLTELLEFKKTNEVVLGNRLRAFHWNIDDSYICVTIYLQERDYSTYANEFTCHRLENLFPGFCIFIYQDRILVVANPERSEIKEDDFFQTLAVFLREGLFRASVSSVGHDFRLFYYYFLQTDIAFRIGSRKTPTLWIYKFNDYKLQYILEQATNELMPLMLCESNLLHLYTYDQKHNSGLFDTLRVYLNNERNLAETTRTLFVHRSTLLYRIDKIKSLIKVDLDDPKTRLHLMLSYDLLDNMPPDGLMG